MSSTPAFATVPHNASVNIAVANATRTGTSGTLGTLITAASAGTRVDDIAIKAQVTTTTGMIRFFLNDGTNFYLLAEVLVSAITASATVASFEDRTTLKNLGWILKTGWSIRVSTEKAESFDISVTRAGDFS